MNIFEQYGINEVANCTLYAITLDKYDDEVYVPILYFDTLKVSTIEQTAEQVSARGGIGNPELITWDYGKEITLTLEDALYNPASQSLMWGGKFGIQRGKIWGDWTPKIFPKDKSGRTLYAQKVTTTSAANEQGQREYSYYPYVFDSKSQTWKQSSELTTVPQDEDDGKGWIEFICPCDNEPKFMKYIPTSSRDGVTECSFITIENFGDFKYNGLELLNEETSEDYNEITSRKYYDPCNKAMGLRPIDSEQHYTHVEYDWLNCDVRLRARDLDVYYTSGVGVRYTSEINCSNKTIRFARENLYLNSNIDKENPENIYGAGDNIFYHNNVESNEIVTSFATNDRKKYYKELSQFSNTLNFYKDLTWTIKTQNGQEVTFLTKILVGTFEVNDSKNDIYADPTFDMINPIQSGLEDVPFLERMEECVASKTFAINADRNFIMNQYRYLQQYAQTPLTVFLNPKTQKPYEVNSDHFHKKNGEIVRGNLAIIKQGERFLKWTRSRAPENMSLGYTVTIDAEHFPGTYRLVGETYARSRTDFKDQRLQFEIPLCKMSSDTNLTLEAGGEPTTFTMNLRVLRKDDGTMMKITQYSVDDKRCEDSHSVIPIDQLNKIPKCDDVSEYRDIDPLITYDNFKLEILSPFEFTPYCLPQDYTINKEKITPFLQVISKDSEGMENDIDIKNKTKIKVKRSFDKVVTLRQQLFVNGKPTGEPIIGEAIRTPQTPQILTQDTEGLDLTISVTY